MKGVKTCLILKFVKPTPKNCKTGLSTASMDVLHIFFLWDDIPKVFSEYVNFPSFQNVGTILFVY